MAKIDRKPPKVDDWIKAGNAPPDAGHIQAYLESKGITFIDSDPVSVNGDGTITIGETDATAQKVRATLDAIDPAALDPTEFSRETQLAALTAILADIRSKPEQAQTPAERGLTALAGLQGLDSGMVAPAGQELSAAGQKLSTTKAVAP
jgi:hypothetical protein